MNGTQFPRGRRSGNCDPDCALRVGHSFRNAVLAETVSQNRCPKRSVASQWAMFRKVHPGMNPQSGTRFPKPAPSGNCIPEFAFRVGCNFRLSLDWETASHSHKNGRLGCWSEPPVWRAMSRPLARYVIPNDVGTFGENVATAGRHGRFAVNGVHPATLVAVLHLGQAADSGDIRAVRRAARIHGKP